MAKNDIFCQFFIFPFSYNQWKNAKMEYICGYFLFFVFSALNQKTKKQNIDIQSIEFFIFLFLAKKIENYSCVYFLLRFHILVNWRNFIDLVEHAVVILNVHANDLLKYLDFNGRIRASSVEGLGIRQFLAGPSKDGGD